MQFSFTTTTSEADWRQWATRNIDVSDGGISLSRTTTLQASTLDSSIRDIALGPTGLLYTLSSSGTLSQYNPNTESQRLLLGPQSDTESGAGTLCAGRNRVYVADAEGTIETVSLRRSRKTGHVESDVADPATLAYSGGSMYAIDGDSVVAVAGETTLDWDLDAPRDIAVTEAGVVALDDGADGPVVRVSGGDSPVVEADSFHADGESFTPVAVAVPGESLVVAGTPADSDDHALFEWDTDSAGFVRLSDLAGQCHELTGRSDRDDMRTLYAVVGDDRTCTVLTEVTENVRHPAEDNHAGLALRRYDSGVRGMEWHRLTVELARSSVNTQVRLWYHATDDPGLLALDTDGVETDGGVTSSQSAAEHSVVTDCFSASERETLQSLGVDSLWELANADVGELAGRRESVTPATIRSFQERAFDALRRHAETNWTLVDDSDSQDILLADATGRYLTVAIELLGTPTASPLVDSVRAYCPRQSYLRYMPELYQQDQESAAFLEQFLSVFETSFTDVQSEIEAITRYFDPSGSPTESLDWLEGWLAADEYRDWPESARREYLARAPELYKMRGTRRGLRELIELYLRHTTDGTIETATQAPAGGEEDLNGDTPTGHRLFFLDRADLDRISGGSDGALFESLLPTDRSLVVFCGPFESDRQREAIETIVATETPAHVDSSVLTLDREFVLGQGTFLGLNAELGTQSFSLGDAQLGKDTYLGATE